MFIPFVRQPQAGGGSTFGVGDIEVQPFKYALVNRPDLIFTLAPALVLPTGSERHGLGEGRTVFEPHLFLDRASGNWFFGLNLAAGFTLSGEKETELEYGATLAYSFIKETRRFAPPSPRQRRVVALSLELAGGQALRGGEDSRPSISLVPGVHLWDTRSGWQARFGMGIPVTKSREADQVFHFQVGTHMNWNNLFGRRRSHHDE